VLRRRTSFSSVNSTGAIYITQFIRKAQRLWADGPGANQQFDVVFLAPAVTYETFYDMIAEAGTRVRDLRIFAMRDETEEKDTLIYQLLDGKLRPLATYYDRSLLYLVSGVFEPAIDKPLLGMMRFQDRLSPKSPQRKRTVRSRRYTRRTPGHVVHRSSKWLDEHIRRPRRRL